MLVGTKVTAQINVNYTLVVVELQFKLLSIGQINNTIYNINCCLCEVTIIDGAETALLINEKQTANKNLSTQEPWVVFTQSLASVTRIPCAPR